MTRKTPFTLQSTHFFTLALALTFLFASRSVLAESAVNNLVERLDQISTIQGQFVQYSVDQRGSRIQESRGEFKASRPGRFYWYTSDPLEQAIYSDGKRVTIYDPDLEQATVQKMNDQLKETPAILFSGDVARIGDLYEVEEKRWSDEDIQYLLRPKSKESLFNHLKIRFSGKQLSEMRLSDSLGQETTVSFIHTEINMDLPDSVFEPRFPPGTDVIRDVPLQAGNGG